MQYSAVQCIIQNQALLQGATFICIATVVDKEKLSMHKSKSAVYMDEPKLDASNINWALQC